MRIAVDAAGSEPGPDVIVEGAALALEELNGDRRRPTLVLYGPAEALSDSLNQFRPEVRDHVELVDAPDVVEMSDQPREALLNKPNSSIVRGVKDLNEGGVDAFVSMGNTGAVVGACRTFLGKLRWIGKPALGVPLPRTKGMGFMLDVGATPDPKSGHMVQFAAMGAAFVERVYGVARPRVGLLNIGSEAHKGDELARDVHRLLARCPLNFVGNVEGGDLFRDRADVIVTTGFVGNILLKFTETVPEMIAERLEATGLQLTGGGSLAELDYRRYGGATLLGVDGRVVIGHGRSTPAAVARAVRWAHKMTRSRVIDAMRDKVFRTRRALWLSNPFVHREGSDDA